MFQGRIGNDRNLYVDDAIGVQQLFEGQNDGDRIDRRMDGDRHQPLRRRKPLAEADFLQVHRSYNGKLA